MSKLWGGRFEDETDELLVELSESVSFDARLAPWDIRGSIVHAKMLGEAGIIPKTDAQKIMRGLKSIEREVQAGLFVWDISLEDVHTNIESALIKKIGDAGKRLHTGRSRNDQIATDMRLWARDQIDVVIKRLRDVQAAMVDVAERHMDVVMPGFTHLQHAQPVLLAHHFLAYFEMFDRDRQRFSELRKRVNVLPLGSAALAGASYPLDRKKMAQELGFDAISANSMDAVSDRDFLIEFCAGAAIAMMHLSRLCEELVMWSSIEFSFIEIGDAFTTGSSIMPQKKNPDAAELIRGKTGRVYGDLLSLLTVMKGLPLTYNRDMQEDKEPAFDASDNLQLCLTIAARMIPGIRFNKNRMAEVATEGFMEATDLADALVAKGTPFREAHVLVGKIVLYCVRLGKKITDLSPEDLAEFSPLFDAQLMAQLRPLSITARRDISGGTAPRQVAAALRRARSRITRK